MRMHFRVRKRCASEVRALMLAHGRPFPEFEAPVRVEFERVVARRQHLMDWDNAAASFKLIGDELVALGILPDDSPEWIHEFRPLQSVVRSESLAGTRVALYALAGSASSCEASLSTSAP